MADFSSLKNQILDDIKHNKTVATSQQRINAQLKNGAATYKSAADFSKSLGTAVGDSFKKNVDDVPSEELGAFARAVVAPVYSQEQKTMLSVCSKVQKQINKDAGLEINPVEVKQDISRIQHIVQRFEEASSFVEVSFLLGENVAQSIARGAVNDSMGDNIDFQEDAGLQTLIVRTDGGGCCDWCASVCGEFHSRAELPEDFWRIHRNCSCVIDYRVGKTNKKIKYKTNKDGSLEKSVEEIGKGSTINSKDTNSIIDKTVFSNGKPTCNPNYLTSPGYTSNCGNSSVTYEMSRRGLDYEIEANPSISMKYQDWEKMFIGAEPEQFFPGMKPGRLGKTEEEWKAEVLAMPTISQQVSQQLLNLHEDGARGSVYLKWKEQDFGHYFSWEIVDNEVRYVDAQSGKTDASKHFENANPNSIMTVRWDNLEPSDMVYNCFKKKD